MMSQGYSNPYRPGNGGVSSGRGRGGRGRGRGRGGSGLTHVRAGPDELAVHPRGRFEKLRITPEDLVVEEVGYYSLLGGGRDGQEDISVYPDRRALRVLQIACKPGQPQPARFNLDEGFNGKTMEFIHFRQEIPTMWQWMQTASGRSRVDDVRDQIQFISSKSVLGDLAKSVYNKDMPQEATNWIFGAAKVGNVILIGHLIRDGVDSVFEVDERTEPAHSAYRGRRFETYMTKNADEKNLYSEETGHPKFRSVFHVTLKDFHVLMESGIDAADPTNLGNGTANYVDLTILPRGIADDESKLIRHRMCRWWTNNIFPKIQTIHVGVHDDGQVSKILTYRLDDLLQHVAAEEQKTSRLIWSAGTVLGFMHELLAFVKRSVVKSADEAVYEFRAPSSGDGPWSFMEFPARVAKGHSYIPEGADRSMF